ncbi:hypothetical protein CAPTEDRAFT_218793, partial [Capitella teleta]
MASKMLINTPSDCVDECLRGLVTFNPGLQILQGHRVVVRSDIDKVKADGKVTLISGGGSGHEPAHAGYVGPGMLSAAVAGAVFTSPAPASILAAIQAVTSPGGTLLIVKNYTGDRLNFGLASEQAKGLGMQVDMVVVAEDCALTSADKTAGRRGLCGTVLVHKIAGALAEEGRSLQEIASVCRQAVSAMGTIGLSLSACSLPGRGPSFSLAPDEMELGLGIHGEAGVCRLKVQSARDAVRLMLEHMTNGQSASHLTIGKGDHVALMVNNLGGTSVLEMNIVADEAVQWLEREAGAEVTRAFAGSFMTSLQMAGVSLTVLRLDGTTQRCLDAATQASAWVRPFLADGQTGCMSPCIMKCDERLISPEVCVKGAALTQDVAAKLSAAISAACRVLIAQQDALDDLDRVAGDADCGSTHARGATAILSLLEKQVELVSRPQSFLLAVAASLSREMGGSSGALYSLFFPAAAGELSGSVDSPAWVKALSQGVSAIMRYGGAEPGDRTMLDALQPMCSALQLKIDLRAAAKAAVEGSQQTKSMRAHAGRASYVAADQLTAVDPGAHAVAIWMTALAESLQPA